MAEQLASTPIDINNENPIELLPYEPSSGSIALYGLLIFTQQAGKLKDSVAEKATEIEQCQQRIKLIHDVLQTINKLSNEKGLDISQHPEIQEKLKVARELGVDFDESKLVFSPDDRDFLKESLQLTESEFVNYNKMQTQKMQMLIQEADRWITLANTLLKSSERTSKSNIDKMR